MSLEFDSNDQFVETSHTATLTQRTVLIWCYHSGDANNVARRAFSKNSADESWWWNEALLGDAREWEYGWSTHEGQWRTDSGDTTSVTGSWIPVIVRYDAGSTANNPSVRFAGSELTLNEEETPSGTANTNTEPYIIGNRASDFARGWSGMLAEFAVWDVLLSDGDCALLESGDSPLAVNTDDCAVYHRLLDTDDTDDLTGNTAGIADLDVAGNGASHPSVDDPPGGTTQLGVAALSGVGTIAATGTASRPASAALSGTGALATTATATRTAATAPSGTATIAASATVTRNAAVALNGAGTISASATTSSEQFGAAALSGTATIAASATVTRSASAALSGTATIAATATATRPGATALSGTGSIATTAAATRAAIAALTGVGTLAASATADRFAAAALIGTGTIAASASGATAEPEVVAPLVIITDDAPTVIVGS